MLCSWTSRQCWPSSHARLLCVMGRSRISRWDGQCARLIVLLERGLFASSLPQALQPPFQVFASPSGTVRDATWARYSPSRCTMEWSLQEARCWRVYLSEGLFASLRSGPDSHRSVDGLRQLFQVRDSPCRPRPSVQPRVTPQGVPQNDVLVMLGGTYPFRRLHEHEGRLSVE